MIRKTVTVAATALSLMAAPALAQDAPTETGKSTAPGQVCKNEKKKKRDGQKKSDFASCVVGAKKGIELVKTNEQRAEQGKGKMKPNPARACKSESKTKAAGATKTQFAICVTGYEKARKAAAAA